MHIDKYFLENIGFMLLISLASVLTMDPVVLDNLRHTFRFLEVAVACLCWPILYIMYLVC